MKNKNSEIEDAIFQIRNLEEALNRNAQGILASTMKEEISSLVKESLKEAEEGKKRLTQRLILWMMMRMLTLPLWMIQKK